jgi:hypothetical protein
MIIRLSEFGTHLQGKAAGKKHFARICGMLAEVQAGEYVFLDFAGVTSVNGSWINMAVSPLLRWSAENQNDLFPILCCFPTKDFDELELVAQVNQQCYPVAPDAAEPIRSIVLVGPLDESLRATMESLGQLKQATGAELARHLPEAHIQATAWNNRLKELYDKRLLHRRKEGRQQIYFPVADEVHLHG